jgi:hypothetical protein
VPQPAAAAEADGLDPPDAAADGDGDGFDGVAVAPPEHAATTIAAIAGRASRCHRVERKERAIPISSSDVWIETSRRPYV